MPTTVHGVCACTGSHLSCPALFHHALSILKLPGVKLYNVDKRILRHNESYLGTCSSHKHGYEWYTAIASTTPMEPSFSVWEPHYSYSLRTRRPGYHVTTTMYSVFPPKEGTRVLPHTFPSLSSFDVVITFCAPSLLD